MTGWIGVLARLAVGGVWMYAGALKLPHPQTSVTAVSSYQLPPTGLAETVGDVLPVLEIVVGACLVLGLLLALSLPLVRCRRTPVALDGLLFPPAAVTHADGREDARKMDDVEARS
jgi:hypothetical protein